MPVDNSTVPGAAPALGAKGVKGRMSFEDGSKKQPKARVRKDIFLKGRRAKAKSPRAVSSLDEEIRVADDDGDTSTDAEPCARCGCPRASHEIGRGECTCGCVRFVG